MKPRVTFWRVVLLLVLTAGLVATVARFVRGLGGSTHLSDAFPWGLWIGFDILCGVGLAAGGFTLTAAVHIFNIKKFKPVVRPAILTAFLGYLLVVFALIFDLGKPWNIWHPLVMWNPHSVMFEVAWCVTLYTMVLGLEFSPMLWEKLGWTKVKKVVSSVTPVLVIFGVMLSTLHQSSLGSLFLIAPGKLHPLWYSPWLPVFFFLSSIAVGCAMVIFESFLSRRAFGHSVEFPLLVDLGRVALIVLILYSELRFLDLKARGALSYVNFRTEEGSLFLAEIFLGVAVPVFLLAIPKIRQRQGGLFAAATFIVLGFVLNRLNVGLTGLQASSGVRYIPSWMEIAVTTSLVGAGFAIFALAVRHLPVFAEEVHSARPPRPMKADASSGVVPCDRARWVWPGSSPEASASASFSRSAD
ncbi:MAG: Ni/Fe-hydrogenase cytochrome b subunit [Candidatus Eisenbacteria bacterium]